MGGFDLIYKTNGFYLGGAVPAREYDGMVFVVVEGAYKSEIVEFDGAP